MAKAGSGEAEVGEGLTADIAQFHALEVVPDALVRVEVRGVARELFQADASGTALSQEVLDRLARNQTKLAVLLDEADEAGVMLECVTEKVEDSPLGKLVMSLRAFAAEVERKKIAERTTRGKLERAKSGRIPQAFGRGCYGYVYLNLGRELESRLLRQRAPSDEGARSSFCDEHSGLLRPPLPLTRLYRSSQYSVEFG